MVCEDVSVSKFGAQITHADSGSMKTYCETFQLKLSEFVITSQYSE